MKTLLNLKLHPALILSSVFFWTLLYISIYAAIVLYWIHKVFYLHETNLNVVDAPGTIVVHKVGKTIYRKELKFYADSLKLFVKR